MYIEQIREYFGVWKVQILGIDPDFNNQTNTVMARLIEQKDIVVTRYLRGTTGGAYRVCAGTPIIKRSVAI